MMGVQCNITSAYHPQSNGLDERFNQTLQRQLLKYVNDEQTDWDLHLDAVLFLYRVSRQDLTKTSPFLLVYGRQPKLPVEFCFQSTGKEEKDDTSGVVESEIKTSEHEANPQDNLLDEEDASAEEQNSSMSWNNQDEGLQEHIRKLVKIRKTALNNIKVAQEHQQRQYDAKHCKDKAKYKVGTLVLVKNSWKLTCKGSKMDPNWLGPYHIHEVLNKGTFRLSQVKDGKVLAQLYNMTWLKLYYSSDCPSCHTSTRLCPSCRKRCGAKKSCPCRMSKRCCTEWCHPGRSCTNCEESDVIDLDEYQPTVKCQQVPQMWVQADDIILSEVDEKDISSGGWLSDNVINGCQNLL